MKYGYHTKDFTVSLEAEEYLRRFRDEERINGYCRMCSNYGKSWACPPFLYDMDAVLQHYRQVFIIATRITPDEEQVPFSALDHYLRPERIEQERLLLDLERKHDARSFAYAGTCLYCSGTPCARTAGQPCRHPELVRSSLEAAGFDVGRTVTELFGFDLKWGSKEFMPEYLTLVGALFHNGNSIVWTR